MTATYGKVIWVTEQQYDFIVRVMTDLEAKIDEMKDENGELKEEDVFDYDIAHADAGMDLVEIFQDIILRPLDESFEG